MNYKSYFYVFFILLSAFAISGINFDNFIKKNHKWEARILVIILSFIFGYLITNFVVDFVSLT